MRHCVIVYPFLYLMLLIPIIITIPSLCAQEINNTYQTATSVELSKKIMERLKFEFTPEVRWEDGLSVDKFLLNSELKYHLFDFMLVSAGYRLIGNNRDTKSTEYLNRYQFKTIFKTDIQRWEPGFRLSYTNYSDDNDGDEFFRYKWFTSYNIKNSKITPVVGLEVFHQVETAKIYKLRYSVGLDFKLSKRLALGCGYNLDYYRTKYKNRHTLDIGLKVKL